MTPEEQKKYLQYSLNKELDPVDDAEAEEETVNTRPAFVKKERPNYAIQDALVGATPALLGLLTGNPLRANMGFEQSNAYLSNLKKSDEEAAKDLVKTVDENGYPIYTPSREAAGEQVYESPKKAHGGNAKTLVREFESIDNPNETFLAYIDPNTKQTFDSRTGVEVDFSRNRPKSGIKLVTSKDQFGNITTTPIQRAGGVVGEKTTTTTGEGAEINIPLSKIRNAEKVQAKYVEKTSKYQEDLADMASSKSILSDKNAAPQAQKQAVGRIIKQIENRMTDADRAEYKNEASVLVNIGNKIDMMSTNKIPDQLIRAFTKAAKDMEEKIKFTSRNYRESTIRGYAGKDKKLRKYIDENLSSISSNLPYTPSEPQKVFGGPEIKSEPLLKKASSEDLKRLEQLKKIKAERAKK